MSYHLLLTEEDYTSFNTPNNLIYTGVILFVTLWIGEFLTLGVLATFGNGILKDYSNRKKITRNINESAAMLVISYLGYLTFISLKGFEPFQQGVGVKNVIIIS
jgi:hypothetical protein